MGVSQQILLGQIMADETQGTDKDSGRCSVPVKQCQAALLSESPASNPRIKQIAAG